MIGSACWNRITAVAVAAAVFAVAGGWAHDNLRSRKPQDEQKAFASREASFNKAKSHLPHSGIVGYLLDDPDRLNAKADARYFSAQYNLAPLLLVEPAGQEWIVCEFSDPMQVGRFMASGEYASIHSVGNNIFVMRRRGGP